MQDFHYQQVLLYLYFEIFFYSVEYNVIYMRPNGEVIIAHEAAFMKNVNSYKYELSERDGHLSSNFHTICSFGATSKSKLSQ